MANVYREIFDEILVGIVAFALVGVILPAAGGTAVEQLRRGHDDPTRRVCIAEGRRIIGQPDDRVGR
jgi:hypothetical protein